MWLKALKGGKINRCIHFSEIMCHGNISCRAHTAFSEITCASTVCGVVRNTVLIIFGILFITNSCCLWFSFFLFLYQKSSPSASACVHLQYLCLFIYLSTSITSPLASQGNWVLHVIAPWENQIGTSAFLWVCAHRVPDAHIQSFCHVARWHVKRSDLCGVLHGAVKSRKSYY